MTCWLVHPLCGCSSICFLYKHCFCVLEHSVGLGQRSCSVLPSALLQEKSLWSRPSSSLGTVTTVNPKTLQPQVVWGWTWRNCQMLSAAFPSCFWGRSQGSWVWAAAGSTLLISLVLNAWGDAAPARPGAAGYREPSRAPKGSFISACAFVQGWKEAVMWCSNLMHGLSMCFGGGWLSTPAGSLAPCSS